MKKLPRTRLSSLVRILHLDDDSDDIHIFNSILTLLDPVGYMVTSVSTIQQARSALSRESFDIIVADYKLDQSDEDGTSSPLLLEVLKQSSYLPVLLTSGQMHIPIDPELKKYLEGGRIRFVTKDMLSVDQLENQILKQLNNYYAVLVIEDDRDDRELVADILSRSQDRNFDMQFATTLTEARESVLAHVYDIILCDWHLGVERSAEFIIETADAYPDTCIVFLTGNDPVDLPIDVFRMFGRRRIAFHSKNLLHVDRFETFLISHMNRLVGTETNAPVVAAAKQEREVTSGETAPAVHEDEDARQQALDALKLVYRPAERRFDVITAAAKRVFQVPIVLISLVHHEKQWFKSAQGIAVAETERCISFCGHAILQRSIFEVEDASQHPLFKDNPLVTGPPGIRFYAGIPVRSEMGFPLGTLCLIDTRPRKLDAMEGRRLRALGNWVEAEMENCGLTPPVLETLAEQFDVPVKVQLDEHTKCWGRAAGELLLSGILEQASSVNLPATVGLLQLRTAPPSQLSGLPPEQLAEIRLQFANAVRLAFGKEVMFFADSADLIYFMHAKPGRLARLPDITALSRTLNLRISESGQAISVSVGGVVCHKTDADGRQKKNVIDRLKQEVNSTTGSELRVISSW